MAGRPDTWMPMYWGDYLRDTVDLSTVEHGAYMLLIGAYWTRNGPLADDDAKLARIARLPIKEWMRVRVTLSELFDIAGGLWRHKRVDLELAKAADRYASTSTRAKRAAAARWSREQSTEDSPRNATSNAASMPEAMLADAQPQPQSPNGDIDSSGRAPKANGHDPAHELAFEEFWKAYPKRDGNPKKPARQRFLAILKDGVEAETIIRGARNYAIGMQGREQQFIAHAATWLNQARWNEHQERPRQPQAAGVAWL